MREIHDIVRAMFNLLPIATFISGVVFTKLIEYMFERYENRKRLHIEVLPLDAAFDTSSFVGRLSVRNIGAKDLGILKFGYVLSDSGKYEQNHKDVFNPPRSLKPEQPAIDLIFHDGERYVPVKKDKVLYYFVETGAKTFYLYPRGFLMGWFRRHWQNILPHGIV